MNLLLTIILSSVFGWYAHATASRWLGEWEDWRPTALVALTSALVLLVCIA